MPTKFHYFLETLSLMILFLIFINFMLQWGQITEPVPTHFGFDGQADAWGSKNSLLLLPIVSLGLYILLTVVEFFPNTWNFPVQATEENRDGLISLSLDMLIMLKLMVLVCYFGINYCSLAATSIPVWFLPSALLVLFGSIWITIYKMIRYNKTLSTKQKGE